MLFQTLKLRKQPTVAIKRISVIIIPKCLTWLYLAYVNSKTGLMTAHSQACMRAYLAVNSDKPDGDRRGRARLGARYRQELARNGHGTIRPAKLRRRGAIRQLGQTESNV
jgi:hypothetical protein